MILPLEKQVCSLELAKRLKELGAPQESLFKWIQSWHTSESKDHQEVVNDGWGIKDASPVFTTGQEVFKWWYAKAQKIEKERYAAFTCAELGELMKGKSGFDEEYGYSAWNGVWKEWGAFIFDCDAEESHRETATTEADARAKMLIYLLKQKLISL